MIFVGHQDNPEILLTQDFIVFFSVLVSPSYCINLENEINIMFDLSFILQRYSNHFSGKMVDKIVTYEAVLLFSLCFEV